MEYAICEASSAEGLSAAVNAKPAAGWQLCGNLVVVQSTNGNWWYYQAVFRDADPADEADATPGEVNDY